MSFPTTLTSLRTVYLGWKGKTVYQATTRQGTYIKTELSISLKDPSFPYTTVQVPPSYTGNEGGE